jgi:hypothetical protein
MNREEVERSQVESFTECGTLGSEELHNLYVHLERYHVDEIEGNTLGSLCSIQRGAK